MRITFLEKILLSTVLYKYNKKLKRQERSILITSKAIYNVNKQEFLASIISVFNSSYQIRRRIDVAKLKSISISNVSSEFVLHVPEEYDYRYSSPQKRDRILTMICKAFYANVGTVPLKFFFIDEIGLVKYTTTKVDKKNGISKIPLNNCLALDEASLSIKLTEIKEKNEKLKANTETVFHKGDLNQKVTLDDFEILKVLGRGALGKASIIKIHKAFLF